MMSNDYDFELQWFQMTMILNHNAVKWYQITNLTGATSESLTMSTLNAGNIY